MILTAAEFAASSGGQVAASDPRLGLLLAAADAAVTGYCGWHVAPELPEMLTMDGPGGDLLVLPTLRLVSVTSLQVSGTVIDVDNLEWSANGEARLGSHGVGCRGFGWGTRFQSIRIGIVHGFAKAADLKQVVQQVVGNAIMSPLGATREQAGQVSVQWSTTAPGVSGGLSLLERDMAILDRYRLPQGA